MSQWKINDLIFEYDFDDVESMERYEQAFYRMQAKADNLPKEGTRSSFLRFYCQAFWDLFDDLFGPGTSDKLFQGKLNAVKCDEVYEKFLEFVKENVQKSDSRRLNKFNNNKNRKKRYHPNKKQFN